MSRTSLASVASVLVLVFGAATAQAQLFTPAPQPVLSQLGPYAVGHVGGSFPTKDPFTNSIAVGGGLGWRFSPNIRADLDFTYRPDLAPNVSNWTTMLNGYYDFNSVSLGGFVPYLKAGAGIAENSVGDSTVAVTGTTTSHIFGSDKTQFAWDVGAGLSYALSDHTAIDLDYQYISMGRTANSNIPGSFINIPTGGNLRANEVKIGLRYGF